MTALIGSVGPGPEALKRMRAFAEKVPTVRWAVFQNHDLGSGDIGHLRFLAIGPDCTFKTAPGRLPDTAQSINWQYAPAGWVNLKTGAIEEKDTIKEKEEQNDG